MIQSGTVATIRAAMPLGTDCSAHITRALPTESSSTPIRAYWRSCRGLGQARAPSRRQAAAAITNPATRKRSPALASGGASSTTTRMAR